MASGELGRGDEFRDAVDLRGRRVQPPQVLLGVLDQSYPCRGGGVVKVDLREILVGAYPVECALGQPHRGRGLVLPGAGRLRRRYVSVTTTAR
jgi:hypothetical protein